MFLVKKTTCITCVNKCQMEWPMWRKHSCLPRRDSSRRFSHNALTDFESPKIYGPIRAREGNPQHPAYGGLDARPESVEMSLDAANRSGVSAPARMDSYENRASARQSRSCKHWRRRNRRSE